MSLFLTLRLVYLTEAFSRFPCWWGVPSTFYLLPFLFRLLCRRVTQTLPPSPCPCLDRDHPHSHRRFHSSSPSPSRIMADNGILVPQKEPISQVEPKPDSQGGIIENTVRRPKMFLLQGATDMHSLDRLQSRAMIFIPQTELSEREFAPKTIRNKEHTLTSNAVSSMPRQTTSPRPRSWRSA